MKFMLIRSFLLAFPLLVPGNGPGKLGKTELLPLSLPCCYAYNLGAEDWSWGEDSESLKYCLPRVLARGL